MTESKKAQKPTKLTAKQREALTNRSKVPWRERIIEFLRTNGPATPVEIHNATRPDRAEITDAMKTHNVASQLTYLKQDGYVLLRDEDNIVPIADPKDNLFDGADKYLERLSSNQ